MKKVTFIIGGPCTGKTTLAKEIVGERNALFFLQDNLKSPWLFFSCHS